MKQKEKQTIRNMKVAELRQEVIATEKQWKKWRIDRYVKEMKNSRQAKQMRKKIAYLLTCIREQELSQDIV